MSLGFKQFYWPYTYLINYVQIIDFLLIADFLLIKNISCIFIRCPNGFQILKAHSKIQKNINKQNFSLFAKFFNKL